MNDEELEQAIIELVSDYINVWPEESEITFDGTFTYQEIVAIAELLKKEGRV